MYDWLPVHRLKTAEVFERIRQAEQEPFWAYKAGNRRLSCVFCIFGCAGDLANGRRHRPELYAEYVALQDETGWTMFPGQSLQERCDQGDAVEERRSRRAGTAEVLLVTSGMGPRCPDGKPCRNCRPAQPLHTTRTAPTIPIPNTPEEEPTMTNLAGHTTNRARTRRRRPDTAGTCFRHRTSAI